MLKQYDGELGKFQYDNEYWEIGPGEEALYYGGLLDEKGAIESPIPEGLQICAFLFTETPYLRVAPVIPKSAIDCTSMFESCRVLRRPPIIPDGVLSCDHMFSGCSSLEDAPVLPDSIKNVQFMFKGCTSLKEAPAIPRGAEGMDTMFWGASLQKSLFRTSLTRYFLDIFRRPLRVRKNLCDWP